MQCSSNILLMNLFLYTVNHFHHIFFQQLFKIIIAMPDGELITFF